MGWLLILLPLVHGGALSEIQTLAWGDLPRPQALTLVEARLPAVLEDTPALLWRAQQWNPSYIVDRTGRLYSVYTSQDPLFRYFNSDKMLRAAGDTCGHNVIDMDAEHFFAHISEGASGDDGWSRQGMHRRARERERERGNRAETAGGHVDPDGDVLPFIYYSGDVGLLGRLSADVGSIEDFVLLEPLHLARIPAHDSLDPASASALDEFEDALLARPPPDPKINAWFGGQNVTASTHYDMSHNFYCQLYGRKQFELWPPSKHTALGLYPRRHPRYRQATRRNADPLLKFVLEGKQCLYLPPFWFHRVTALEVSMSVNVWYDAVEADIVDAILALPLPLGNYDGEVQLDAARGYVWSMVSTVLDTTSPQLVRDVLVRVAKRHYDVFGEDTIASMAQDLTSVEGEWSFCSEESFRPVSMRSHDAIMTKMPVLRLHFLLVPDLGSREVLLGNYIEDVLLFLVGLDLTGAYLHACLLRSPYELPPAAPAAKIEL